MTAVLNLLVVDDDPSIIRLMVRVVDSHFGNVVKLRALTDPSVARDALEKGLVDVLVTDLEMPGVDGLELLRTAKRRNPLTQVLFITGRSSLDALLEALESGATDYLLKPLDVDTLVRLLRQSEERVQRWREALAGTLTSHGENQLDQSSSTHIAAVLDAVALEASTSG
jgi:DNA-binding NtrC family response regulator